MSDYILASGPPLSRELIERCIRVEKERVQREWLEPRSPLICSPVMLRSICRAAVTLGIELENEYRVQEGYMDEAREYVRGRIKRRARMRRKRKRGWA